MQTILYSTYVSQSISIQVVSGGKDTVLFLVTAGILDLLSGSDEDILGVERHRDESPTRGMLSVEPGILPLSTKLE
jgi:hypothetical protein